MRTICFISLAMFFISCKKESTIELPPVDSCGDNRPVINIQMNPVATMNMPGSEMVAASAGNKILFSEKEVFEASSGSVYIYDVSTNSLTTTSHNFSPKGYTVASLGNKIFFAGGMDYFDYADSKIGIYDVSTNSWEYAHLSVSRTYASAVTVGNKLLIAGGQLANAYFNSDIVDIYDLTTNSWSTSNLSVARMQITAVAANGKAYFSGGLEHMQSPLSIVDVYDPAANSWSSFELKEKKARMAAIVKENKIFWAGGVTNNGSSRKIEIYDALSQTSSLTCLHKDNLDFEAVMKDDNIVFFTGNNNNGQTIDILNTTTNQWSVGKLPFTIRGAAIISVNNTIYVAGGHNDLTAYDKIWKLEW